MAFYILKDNPDIGALEAITQSRKMMVGYKGKLFCLYSQWGLIPRPLGRFELATLNKKWY
jgi:uncharacterized membrane protein